MKREYVKPVLNIVELRPEERIGGCNNRWAQPSEHPLPGETCHSTPASC